MATQDDESAVEHERRVQAAAIFASISEAAASVSLDHMRCDREGCTATHVLVPQLPKQQEQEDALRFESRSRAALRLAVAQAESCGWERTVEGGSLVDLCPACKEPR